MKIVVVSPHPDDETLGAGGLLLKAKKNGNEIYWVNITNVNENSSDKAFVSRRKEQIMQICKYFNFDGFYDLQFSPSSLENTNKTEIIDAFDICIKKIEPDWIILPDPNDAHGDHLITYEVGMICSKAFRCQSIKKILTMEIISETDFSRNGKAFSPNYFVDITNEIDEKIGAIKIYDTELGDLPFPRNIETIKALSLVRGAAAGCRYAEAFRIIKEIDK